MPTRVTGSLFFDPRDEPHQTAAATSRTYRHSRVVTSEMVLTEFLNSFSDRGQRLRRAAARAVEDLREASRVAIVPQTPQLFEKALRKYGEITDKSWSLTDCASFIIMEEEKLTAALTHDRHFAQAGFQTLLR